MQELEKILEEIEAEHPYKVPGNYDSYSQYNEAWQDAIDRVRARLEIFFKEKENDGWIPAEERLPEEGEKVLVWYEYFRYGEYNRMYETYGISWQYDGYWSGDVSGTKAKCIAWRPLPEAYLPERNG